MPVTEDFNDVPIRQANYFIKKDDETIALWVGDMPDPAFSAGAYPAEDFLDDLDAFAVAWFNNEKTAAGPGTYELLRILVAGEIPQTSAADITPV